MTPHPETFLVTGGTGFLGDQLVRQLLAAGHTVRVLARSQDEDLIALGATWHRGSILDKDLLEAAADGVDGIFHLAGRVEHTRAKGFEALREIHVRGTMAVLKAAKAASARVVYASTCGTVACSRSPEPFGEDASLKRDLAAGWPYYLTKIEAEQEALPWAEAQGVELITMRPSLLLGPGDKRLSSSRTILDFLDKKIPFIPGGGLNIVDVRDVADAFEAAMAQGGPGHTYLIGATNLTLAELFDHLARLSGVPAPRLKLPYALAHTGARLGSKLMGAFGKHDPGLDPVVVEMANHFWYLDDAAARRDLGWNPRPLEDTLRDSIAWVRAHKEALREV